MMNAAIFDLDGTLLDSMSVWQGIVEELLIRKGITPPQRLIDDIEELTVKQKVDFVARRFALRESPDMLLHETHIMIAEKYRTVIQPRLGALAYLRKLKDANVAMCVATLTDREFVLDALAHYGMIELFEFVLTVGEVGKSKEEPDIYLECARRLGANPSNTVVFEDSLYAIRTAKRAGFTVYAVRDEVALPDQNEIKALCNRYIEDFSELL